MGKKKKVLYEDCLDGGGAAACRSCRDIYFLEVADGQNTKYLP